MRPNAIFLLLCAAVVSSPSLGKEAAFKNAAADNAAIDSAARRWARGGPGGEPDFVRHVVPLFSKLGCNNRACHGSFQGQSGFRLSLFGFEPEKDLKAMLEDDGDGLRADPKNPDASLVLFKPLDEEQHEGGQRMQPDSWQHRMFRQWIANGAKFDPAKSVTVERLELTPPEVLVRPNDDIKLPHSAVRLRAIAYFSDGSREDVSGLTVFSSNDDAVATVSGDGRIVVRRTGDTAIIARYAGAVTNAQVLVAAPSNGEPFPWVLPHNKVDELVLAKLKKLNIRPADLCNDADFIRRAYLDVIGMLPPPEATRKFLANRAPGKRAKLIDELLEHPNYAYYWGMKFSDWTGNSKYINNKAILSNWLWQQWIEDKLQRDVSYDEIVYGYVCASSLEGRPREAFLAEAKSILHRAAGRYNYDEGLYAKRRTNELYWSNVERRKPETMVLQTANSFLGLRLECAQCHNHPFDRWTQRDFEQFKSVFMLVRFCDPETGEEKRGGGRGYGVESVEPGVSSRYAGTVKKTPPKLLGGPPLSLEGQGESDPRVELWRWMRSPDNDFFAPAFVNRLWQHYLGKGIVDPPDDFNQGNPPSNPQLLNHLAEEFIVGKFDIKRVHRLILNSRTYQASWRTNESNKLDERNFSHARLRRMPAEVLIDAIADVTGVENNFGRIPKDRPQRAVGQAMPALRYGASRGGYTMKIFGRPDREKTCDCERSNEPSVAQALYLINDRDVLAKLEERKGRLPQLLADIEDDRKLITELYLTALARFPSDEELWIQAKHVDDAPSRAAGMKDVLWSLLNVREFIFNH